MLFEEEKTSLTQITPHLASKAPAPVTEFYQLQKKPHHSDFTINSTALWKVQTLGRQLLYRCFIIHYHACAH